jgi:hypothetical protein
MCAPGVYDRAKCRTESSIRLANLEELVCDLLRTNQILREELARLRQRPSANGIGPTDEFAGVSFDLRSAPG